MDKQNEKLKLKTLKEIDNMFDGITLANTCIIFYKQLNKIRKETPVKYIIAKNFFNSATKAYDYTILCELSKLYDERAETGSLYSILERCSLNPGMFDSLGFNIAFVQEQLNVKKDDINKIKEYRDKCIAHNDKKYFADKSKLLREYPFDFSLFQTLIEFACETLSKVYSALKHKSFSFTSILLDGYDLYSLVDNLNALEKED